MKRHSLDPHICAGTSLAAARNCAIAESTDSATGSVFFRPGTLANCRVSTSTTSIRSSPIPHAARSSTLPCFPSPPILRFSPAARPPSFPTLAWSLRTLPPPVPPHARRPPRRPRPLLRRAVAHRTRRALGHHPHPALRRFPHYRRPHHRRHPPAPAKALRRCGPRLHPDRQTLGLV